LANPHKSLSPHFTRLAKSAIHSAFLVTVFFSFRTDVRAQARASIGSITLPTYDEGPPDPNPPFDVYASENFNYPYTMRTNLTGTKSDHTWRAIILENEYLKCTILPDLGGHIYTCLDKISGQPMFYQNPSIKKAEIGHRGAWAAFGVEYNFPVSHNWASLSPVDFAYSTNADGSASVTVGNIDRPYGMQWTVELLLKPKSTLLEEDVILYNRSDIRHRYYWWDNAAVQVWDDSRIDYPMQFVASHGFTDVYPWPNLHPGGNDLRIIANQKDGPVSYFAHGSHETFMGIWNPNTDTGTAHFSEYKDLPAKKIWSWGADADGMAWRKALSDNQSAYVEVQAGLFRNQETYAFLDPGQTIRFAEYWMPVRGTGGISRANKAAIVMLDVHDATLTAHLNVNAPIPAANISLKHGDQILWHETSDLDPTRTWTKAVTVQAKTSGVTFELRDHDGHSLLTQTVDQYDFDPPSSIKLGPQTAYAMPGPEQRSEDDWLQFGADQELNGKLVQALITYQAALKKFPDSFSLEVAAGRLATSLQRYAEATPLLVDAQSRDTPNSVVAYYLGISEQGLGNLRAAETTYEIAYRQDSMRAPAAIKLGELSAREGRLQPAIDFFKAAIGADPNNARVLEELEAVTRASGSVAEADIDARHDLELSPTSDFLKEELATTDTKHLAADPYRVLRVAAEYMDLGLYEKALSVLTRKYQSVPKDESEPGSVLPQDHPLVMYYAAYCRMKLGRNRASDWSNASKLSVNLVFPSTNTDRLVLDAALAENQSDATANYLLGTLLFSDGLFDAGIKHWNEAKALSKNIPVVDADLGKAWLLIKHDTLRAQQAFIDGSTSDPNNADIYVGLDQAMSLTSSPPLERTEMLSRYPRADSPQSNMPATLVYQLALTRAEAGQFIPALSLFKDRFFAREEGGIASDRVLFEVQLMQAEADAATSHCEPVRNFLINQAASPDIANASRTLFKLAQIAKRCGNEDQAQSLLQKAAATKPGPENLPWMIQANQALGAGDIPHLRDALQNSIPSSGHLSELPAFSSHRWYVIGLDQAALGDLIAADKSFRNALLLPDSFMSHHLARAGLASLAANHGALP
jgi:tetratricopeptide (TPR) repeat protein